MSSRPDFFLALRQARVATHRGDIDAAERWLKICERYLRVVQRYADLGKANPPVIGTPRKPW